MNIVSEMEQKAVIQSCKELGCCDACCLRYLGLKNPSAYENPREFVNKYLEYKKDIKAADSSQACSAAAAGEETEQVPAKKAKTEDTGVCVSCIGVLQEDTWPPCIDMLKEMLDKKRYECATFACALSAPVGTLLRERAVQLHLQETLPHYRDIVVTPLKEAWKWSAGEALARGCCMALESGAVAPLLLSVHLEHAHDQLELDALRGLGAAAGRAGITRRQAERALEAADANTLRAAGLLPPPRPAGPVRPAAVTGVHEPLYLAGRYEKLVRSLPQTPWVVRGERVMPSSVQEIIFAPIAQLFRMEGADAEHRLKLLSAGREDVDVRCLGTGRPFALEVCDPARTPSAAELARACELISASGEVRVRSLVPVARERLADLKHGEQTKSKTYEALCIKLAPGAEEAGGEEALAVSEREVAACARWGGALQQRTPLRVLHRRPLLARTRHLRVVEARAVAEHPRLVALRVRTDAGTYVKEWAHGDLRRTAPSLAHVLGAPADILALDVTEVHLDWP